MNVNGKWSSGCIHDVSDRGLLVSSAMPPAIGTYVDIRRGALVIIGRVVWSGGSRFGVRTQDPVSVAALLSESPPARGTANADRRSHIREDFSRHVIQRADRSRRHSSALQFICLTIIGMGMACFAAMLCYRALTTPLGAVAELLGGPVT